MDPAIFQLMQEAEDLEDAVEADLYNTQLSAALLIMGAEESRVPRSERRNQTRNYLCRPQLQPDPRNNTPWQALFNSRNNRAFITTMGFDVETFELIVRSGFGALWLSRPLYILVSCPRVNKSHFTIRVRSLYIQKSLDILGFGLTINPIINKSRDAIFTEGVCDWLNSQPYFNPFALRCHLLSPISSMRFGGCSSALKHVFQVSIGMRN
jgi:hypothetical protein